MTRQEGEVVTCSRSRQPVEELFHGGPLELERAVVHRVVGNLLAPSRAFPKPRRGPAAVSPDHGRDALGKERILQLLVPLERQVPVQVGVRVDEARGHDALRAVDHDSACPDGLARDAMDASGPDEQVAD